MFLLNVPLEVAPGVVTCGAVNGKAGEIFFQNDVFKSNDNKTCKIKLHNNNKKNRNERDMLVFQGIKTSCSDQRMKFLITNIISAMNFLHSPGVSSLRVNRVF